MKTLILFIALLSSRFMQKEHVSAVYKIIQKTDEIPGNVDTSQINKLTEPLKAMAALYSATGGSMCNGETCELTTALGLGKQGSEQHKALIIKYFPGDSVASLTLRQDCYLPPSGASSFSDYVYLTISVSGNIVRVDYILSIYSHGTTSNIKGPDIYVLTNNTFKKSKRNLWKWADK